MVGIAPKPDQMGYYDRKGRSVTFSSKPTTIGATGGRVGDKSMKQEYLIRS